MSEIDHVYVRLSAVSALLGTVTPNLRVVVVDLKSEKEMVFIYFYYHGQIDEATFDIASTAISEFSANFPPGYRFVERIERLDSPQKILNERYYVFERFEKK